ncbi:motility associated factor glycosyltransferase family protein [Deferrisoma camini]|uniref:motility associated factor glycosyltransferase family protein n=1 Tax=Deferrisoma camini TaxID=1035120 RepID=UPI0004B3C131|nr:6-hydroxymethylpterin diphosphokinase MptE-like protein [Deferrisoma camini]
MNGNSEQPLFHSTRNTWGDEYFTHINGPDFKDEPASEIYKRQYDRLLSQKNAIFVLCGTDSGLLIRHIARNFADNDSFYVFVETDELAPFVPFEQHAESAENLALCTLSELPETLKRVDVRHHFYRNAVFLVPSVCATRENTAHALLLQKLREHLDMARFNILLTSAHAPFILARLGNLADHELPLDRLDGLFEGETAVILGAGPSLDELLPWVQENRPRFTLFAVSRIAKRLGDEGILPDIVATIDPKPASYDISKEMLVYPEDRVLIYETHAYPRLISQWRGRKFFAGPRLPWEPRKDLNYGPTVAHLALWAAIRMGFRRIYLAGVDLCYGPAGKVHESASSGKAEVSATRRDVKTVQTYGGEEAETDYAFLAGIASLEKLATVAREAGSEVANLAARAAKVPGVSFVPPEKAQLPQGGAPAAERVATALPPPTPGQRKNQLQTLVAELEELIEQCRNIRRMAHRGERTIREYAGASAAKRGKVAKEFGGLCTKLQKRHGPILDSLQRLFPDLFYAYFDTKKVADDLKGKIRHDKQLLQAYMATVPHLERMLRIARDKAQHRLLELDPRACPERLVRGWLERKEPLRLHCVDPSTRQRVLGELGEPLRSKLEEACREALCDREVSPQGNFDAGEALGRAQDAFRHRNAAALKRVREALSQRPEVEAAAIDTLAAGLEAELREDGDAAVSYYQQASATEYVPVRREAKRRLAKLLLARGATREAAELLYPLCTEGGPDAPELATTMIRAGHPGLALKALVDLLERTPRDPLLWCLAGEAQEALGETGGARDAFVQALGLAPGNARASEGLRRLEENAKNFPEG